MASIDVCTKVCGISFGEKTVLFLLRRSDPDPGEIYKTLRSVFINDQMRSESYVPNTNTPPNYLDRVSSTEKIKSRVNYLMEDRLPGEQRLRRSTPNNKFS